VLVPDDKFHVAAFRGALRELAQGSSWADDTAHTARDVAKLWRDLLDNLEGCEVPTTIEFRQETNCGLEVRIDSGEWTSIFDAHLCATSAIFDALNDGTIPSPSQTPPGGIIPTGECKTYHVNLRATDLWHCPIPIADGYRITVTNAKGGWYDGVIASNWYCPNGNVFAFGQCMPTAPYYVGSDVAPAIQHMRLVGQINGVFFDMYNQEYTVPDGTGTAELYLQANDSVYNDNQGSAEFDIEICNESGFDWAVVFDFTQLSYSDNWTNDQNNGNSPTGWVSGVGYQSGISGWITRLRCTATAPSACTIHKISVTAGTLFHNGSNGYIEVISDIGSPNGLTDEVTLRDNNGGTFDAVWTTPLDVWNASGHATSLSAKGVSFDHNPGPPTWNDNNTWISRIVIYGNGAIPVFAHL
jgi:hypothetical protein